MSDFTDTFSATIIVADFINTDAVGKINVVGGGLRFLSIGDNEHTPPFSVLFHVDSQFVIDDPVAIEVSLATATGSLVALPGPDGRKQNVRLGHNVPFQQPQIPNAVIPRNAVPIGADFVMNFSNGLPLRRGFAYQFRVQVDHEVIGSYTFFVVDHPRGPVVG